MMDVVRTISTLSLNFTLCDVLRALKRSHVAPTKSVTGRFSAEQPGLQVLSGSPRIGWVPRCLARPGSR